MLFILQTALELGFLYSLVPLALFISFRILNIADMTTDGCFVLGAAVSVTMAAAGHPFLGIVCAMLSGACAGIVTAFLQTTMLFLGLLTFSEHQLLGLGIMLAAKEAPRIAQQFGLDSSVRVNMSSVIYSTNSAVNLTRNLMKAKPA